MTEEMVNPGCPLEDTVMEMIDDKIINSRGLSFSSDSETEKPDSPSSVKGKIYRLFGRERPVHKVLGGGKTADLLLWRDKKASASLLGAATVIWVLFEIVEYHLLTFVCHTLIFSLAFSFLWSKAHNFSHSSPESIPEIHLPERLLLQVASTLRFELNRALAALRDIALGRDLKKFLMVITGLWVVSKVGSWFSLLTLIYICFVLLHAVPMLYQKYEDEIDPYAEKAMIEIRKQYEVLDAKVLSKIRIGRLKTKLT